MKLIFIWLFSALIILSNFYCILDFLKIQWNKFWLKIEVKYLKVTKEMSEIRYLFLIFCQINMSILWTTWLILKWVLFIALVLIVWILYNMILRPWLMRRKYLKYSNWIQSSKFYPVLGDFALLLDSIKQNKFIFSWFMDSVKQNKDFDIRLYFYGEDPRFQIVSLKAHKEFIDLFPHKIDRSESMKKSLAKMWVGSFDQQLTTEKCKLIRSEFLKAIGFNEISTRIEEIIEIFDSFTNTWSEEKEINLIELVQDITFEVINHLLFGNDAAKIMNKWRFIEPDGSESILGFSEWFRRILNDTLAHYHR